MFYYFINVEKFIICCLTKILFPMKQIIWKEIKRNFNWTKIFLIFSGFLVSGVYLFCTFVLYPFKAYALHPGIYKITLWGGINSVAILVFVATLVLLLFFLNEVISLYLYYKRQIDCMTSENTPSA